MKIGTYIQQDDIVVVLLFVVKNIGHIVHSRCMVYLYAVKKSDMNSEQ